MREQPGFWSLRSPRQIPVLVRQGLRFSKQNWQRLPTILAHNVAKSRTGKPPARRRESKASKVARSACAVAAPYRLPTRESARLRNTSSMLRHLLRVRRLQAAECDLT